MSTDDRTPDPLDRSMREAFQRQSSRIEAHVDARAGLEHIKEPSTMSRRNLVPALAGAALVVIAITAVVILRPFGGSEPIAGSTTTIDQTTSSSTTEPTTSTTEPTTSTTEPPGSTTTTSTTTTIPGDWDDGRYLVVGVASDDVLNVRQSPGATNPIVGTIPPNGRVELDGFSALVGTAEWLSVALDDGTIGWVNAAFLAAPPGWEFDLDAAGCASDGPGYGGTQTVSGSGLGDGAGNALDVFTYREPECDRIVIVLGAAAGLENGRWSSRPAATVPAGTSVTSGGSVVEIRIPGIADVRPLAQTIETEFGYVLATRDVSQGQERSDLVFRGFFDSNRRASISWLENPARVVIDVRTAPTGSGLDVAAKRERATVVMPIQVDVNGPGVTTPIQVTGWGRPFEAQGVAVLRRAAPQPGTGALVEATFSGTGFAGTQVTSQYPYMTADYTEAWGAFSFTIDDLAPGSYELFVGDFNMESGLPEGVYQTFTVRG